MNYCSHMTHNNALNQIIPYKQSSRVVPDAHHQIC